VKRQDPRHALRANDERLRRDRRLKRRKIRIEEKRRNVQLQIAARRQFARQEGLFYDSRVNRQPVILPSIFSFAKNYEGTVGVLQFIREHALERGQPVLLHFEHVIEIEPAAALALVAEIYRVRNLMTRSSVHGTYPRDWEVYEGLSNMGFFKLLEIVERDDKPHEETDPEKPVYLQFLTDNRAAWTLVDQFVDIIEKHVMALNPLARQRLVTAVGEAINNTLDHAHPNPTPGSMKNRWWLSASVNLHKKEVAIVVVDQGVGIPNTLPPTEYEQLRAFLVNILQFKLTAEPSDGDKILAATAYHRSGTGSQGRGRGFYDMKRFIDVCSDGELRVLSNRGSYHYMGGQESFDNAEVSIGGTLIEWRFSHNGVVELKDE
jgi:anti-sigma regulatory factor (Ser/Thr protein kinase)